MSHSTTIGKSAPAPSSGGLTANGIHPDRWKETLIAAADCDFEDKDYPEEWFITEENYEEVLKELELDLLDTGGDVTKEVLEKIR